MRSGNTCARTEWASWDPGCLAIPGDLGPVWWNSSYVAQGKTLRLIGLCNSAHLLPSRSTESGGGGERPSWSRGWDSGNVGDTGSIRGLGRSHRSWGGWEHAWQLPRCTPQQEKAPQWEGHAPKLDKPRVQQWRASTLKNILKLKKKKSTELVVQGLRLHTPNAGSWDSTHGRGTISHIPPLRVHNAQLKQAPWTVVLEDSWESLGLQGDPTSPS